jgi:hypothetical protein
MLVRTTNCGVTVPTLLFDPELYLFDFSPSAGRTKFLVVGERMLEQSPFIDIRFEPLAQAQFWVDTVELFALEDRHDIARPKPVFVFHHAFVCSTLLARCLNQIDAFFSLKEPWILRRMADHKRARRETAAGRQWPEMFSRYVGLLCRNFRTGRIPMIKATNVANNLLADVLRYLPGRPVLYLYSDLESFLLSNLKKPADTQKKMPDLASGFLGDSDFPQRFPQISDPARLNFLQVCALTWLVNLYNLRACVEQHGQVPVRTLDAGRMLSDLPGALDQLCRFFGHAPGPGEVERMMDPKVIGTNAKDQTSPYGQEQRLLELNQIRRRHEEELKGTIAWIEPLIAESCVLDFMDAHRLTQQHV